MKKLGGLFLAMILFGALSAQKSFELTKTLPLKNVDAFNVDQFQNLYIIRGSELLKLDHTGKELYSFSNPIFGDLYHVDVLNPMNPYVFYRDANRLAVVDNRLNQNSELNFADYGYLDVRFMSFSDQENVWFYDQATDKLYRFNIRNKKPTNRSLNITQLIGEENEPVNMVSTVENVYLNVPEIGIFVFDAVGAYKRTIPLTDVTAFDVYGSSLYAAQDGNLKIYDLATGRLLPFLFSESGIRQLRFQNDLLYLFDGSSLKTYRRNLKDKQ